MIDEFRYASGNMIVELAIMEEPYVGQQMITPLDVLEFETVIVEEKEILKLLFPAIETLREKLLVTTDECENEYRLRIYDTLFGIIGYYKTEEGLNNIAEDMMYDREIDTSKLSLNMFRRQVICHQQDIIRHIVDMMSKVLDKDMDVHFSPSQKYHVNNELKMNSKMTTMRYSDLKRNIKYARFHKKISEGLLTSFRSIDKFIESTKLKTYLIKCEKS